MGPDENPKGPDTMSEPPESQSSSGSKKTDTMSDPPESESSSGSKKTTNAITSGPLMWKLFEDNGLVIDSELQEVLKASKYDNLNVLSKFSKEDEKNLISFMRTTFHLLVEKDDREKYYGVFKNNPNLFLFVGGQAKTLDMIQKTAKKLVNKQSSLAFLFDRQVPSGGSSSKTKIKINMPQTSAARALELQTQLDKSINAYLNENFEGEFKVESRIAQDGWGSFTAISPCPICPKETRISRNETRWNPSNYYSHLRTHVAPVNNQSTSPSMLSFVTRASTSPANKKQLVYRTSTGGKGRKRKSREPLETLWEEDIDGMLIEKDIEESTNGSSETESQEKNSESERLTGNDDQSSIHEKRDLTNNNSAEQTSDKENSNESQIFL